MAGNSTTTGLSRLLLICRTPHLFLKLRCHHLKVAEPRLGIAAIATHLLGKRIGPRRKMSENRTIREDGAVGEDDGVGKIDLALQSPLTLDQTNSKLSPSDRFQNAIAGPQVDRRSANLGNHVPITSHCLGAFARAFRCPAHRPHGHPCLAGTKLRGRPTVTNCELIELPFLRRGLPLRIDGVADVQPRRRARRPNRRRRGLEPSQTVAKAIVRQIVASITAIRASCHSSFTTWFSWASRLSATI